ncbi:MAG: linear amide C-N hydrolase [Firmicutes bacterium]|nr:linear amide C-N hydrolase [Bacillota bacterium]
MDTAIMENRPKRNNKLFKIIGFSLLGLVLLVVLLVAVLFGGEIASVLTVTQVDNTSLFSMEYKGDYGLDDFLQVGASTDGELVTFMSQHLLKGFPLKFDLPDLGCSTFLAKTPQNEYIFGRNFDNYDTPVLILTTKPKNAYASVSVVNLAFIGYNMDFLPLGLASRLLTLAAPYAPLDGVNEKGLAIGVLQIDIAPTRQNTGKTTITTTSAIRMLLDKAATVAEALDLLQQFDMCSSANGCYHFQIADSTGHSVIVEYIQDEFIVLEENCATNFLLAPGEWYNVGGGQNRYEILADTLKETNGIMSKDEGMDLLNAVHQNSTQWSVLYDLTKIKAELCLHKNYDTPYYFEIK